ncbi:MAG TPA: metallophosphoesterase family protein [Flavitalea sp.]|nr:metallophosphoesterase family protein [Flavitalea sp.]
MTRIGLLSDTHHYLDENIFRHFEHCDEIWHGGDFGTAELAEKLSSFKPLKAVYGNIDGYDIRSLFPETLRWRCEQVDVLMTHIGGYPGRYAPAVKAEMLRAAPQLFISGHSHILKIMYDKSYGCLHINPGAAGKQGWHQMRTIVRFAIDGDDIRDCEVIELGKR